MSCALCTAPRLALCPVPCTLCPTPCALCRVPFALCQAIFDRAHSGDGALTEPEFVSAFLPILRGKFSREELRQWFIRIDANANGSVDWDEFSNFLLLEGQQNDEDESTNRGEYVHQLQPQPPRQTLHSEMITKYVRAQALTQHPGVCR